MKYEQKHLEWFVKGAVEEELKLGDLSARHKAITASALQVIQAVLEKKLATKDILCGFERYLATEAEDLFQKSEQTEVFVVNGDGKDERAFFSYLEADRYSGMRGYGFIGHYVVCKTAEDALELDKARVRSRAISKLSDEEVEALGLTR